MSSYGIIQTDEFHVAGDLHAARDYLLENYPIKSPSEGLRKSLDLAKDIRIQELESQLETVVQFAGLMKLLSSDED